MVDNLDLFYIHQSARYKEDLGRPKCIWCGEPIYQDKAFKMPNEDYLCDDCVEENQKEIEKGWDDL